jgi:periplasmic divalent cation tolerance protein
VAADLVLVLTTLAAGTDGLAFARTLVEERLAACVNVWPAMTSIYRWKGAIEQDLEQQLVIKTTAARVPVLRDRFRTLHPYETPEFIVLTAGDATAAYLAWARESTSPA